MLNDLEEPEPPPQYWSWKKIILWPLGIFLAFVTALWAYDEELEPFDDLLPLAAADPDPARNGYYFLRERWAALPELKNADQTRMSDMLSGKESWDPALVAEIRKGRETLASDAKEAVARPDFKTPAIASYKDTEPMNLAWMVKPVRVLSMEIQSALKDGDVDKAMDIWQEQRALSFRTLEGGQSVIALLVGITMHSAAMVSANDLLASRTLPIEQMERMESNLQRGLPAVRTWQQAMRSEAAFSRTAFMDIAANRPDLDPALKVRFPWLLLKKNVTINRSMREYRHLLLTAFRTFPDKSAATAAGYFEDEAEVAKWKRYLDPNYAGTKLLAENGNSYLKVLPGLTNKFFFEPRALRVKIAILRWRESHPGQWPATLRELVPDFLTEVPEDPFNGRDLEWDPVKRIIFSVGSDWLANDPEFKDAFAWFAAEHESPGLRMDRPPATPLEVPPSKP
ncbi:MAG: hypothetical protein JWL81_3530 [Verrucomicrobiales bacterium]|nr:hypothetical protein [Verrucomicrobiales bacterium]